MTVKVLIDAMLPWRLANLFREYGHEARHVRRLKEMGRTDALIWKSAIENAEIVISCDKDFLAIQANNPSAKFIHYKRNSYNRALILSDFAAQMKNIEAFAISGNAKMDMF
jgi:predicted nuclease of predicted toxin-antitoxin system